MLTTPTVQSSNPPPAPVKRPKGKSNKNGYIQASVRVFPLELNSYDKTASTRTVAKSAST